MSPARSARFPIGAATTVDELERDPHPALARLRRSEPVSWVPALDGWLVSRHDIASAVLRDPRGFTVDDPRFSTARVLGASMLSLDGPEHARHRNAFARAFHPEQTRRRFAGVVQAEAARLVAALRPSGAADLRAGLAGPLAVAVLATALGIDDADVSTVRRWYDAFVAAVSDITAGREPTHAAEEAMTELRHRVEATLDGDNGADGDGGAGSLLVDASRGRDALDRPALVSNAAVLMFGGIDTAEGMIANAALHLLGHPEVLERVRTDRSWLDPVIEESVRMEPAAALVDRYATRDVHLAGASVASGDLVTVSLAGANRDPEVFAEPDRFEPGRANLARHLSFARGPHFCFGAHLARLETRTAMAEVVARLPDLRLGPDAPATPRGLVFRKPERVPARWSAPITGG